MYNFEINAVDEQVSRDGTPLGSRYVGSFVCPSDDHPGEAHHTQQTRHRILTVDQLKTFKPSNYAASRGPTQQVSGGTGSPCPLMGNWNQSAGPAIQDTPRGSITYWYPDGSSAAQRKMFGGPFTRLNYHVKLKQITDGLSQTIFMGEVRVGCSAHAGEGWGFSHSGNGLISTLIPINFDSCNQSNPSLRCFYWDNWVSELGFKSAHPGGALFVLGDASVHFLPEAIDPRVYNVLGGKADGESASLSF
jgi:hypothetical protein